MFLWAGSLCNAEIVTQKINITKIKINLNFEEEKRGEMGPVGTTCRTRGGGLEGIPANAGIPRRSWTGGVRGPSPGGPPGRARRRARDPPVLSTRRAEETRRESEQESVPKYNFGRRIATVFAYGVKIPRRWLDHGKPRVEHDAGGLGIAEEVKFRLVFRRGQRGGLSPHHTLNREKLKGGKRNKKIVLSFLYRKEQWRRMQRYVRRVSEAV